jgi:hypothetical protein
LIRLDVDMPHNRTASSATHRTGPPSAIVPTARSGPVSRVTVPPPGTIEEQVARLADLVLKLSSLADRYEATMTRMAPLSPAFADQRARVETLRATAMYGRDRLVLLSR